MINNLEQLRLPYETDKRDNGWVKGFKGGAGAGGVGMIYLSWTRPSREKAREGAASFIDREWKAFAGTEAERLIREGSLRADLHWLHGDLFIRVRLGPGNREELETELLERAYYGTRDWEARFIETVRQIDGSAPEGRLHIGVAAAFPDGQGGKELWYEAAKGAVLHGGTEDAMERSLRRRAFARLLRERGIYSAYQPIVSLQDGAVYGYEALTRLRTPDWFGGPLQLFAFADAEGSLYALETLAREAAVSGFAMPGGGPKLFINVMAQIMEDPSFSPGQTLRLLDRYGLAPEDVVFEITERDSIADFGAVKKALEHYRKQGYRIAIDDVGAGYSSLQSVVELRPDFLKVDRSIIRNVDQDEMKSYVVQTLMGIGSKMGVSVIAEGIEREEELHRLKELGVPLAQGYLLGVPKPFAR